MKHQGKDDSKGKPKSKYSGGDHEGRMGSPIAGNPAQRKKQVEGIANDVLAEHEAPEAPEAPEDEASGSREDSSEESMDHPATPSPVEAMLHRHHVHGAGGTVTHDIQHGQPCPACGTDYMA